MRYGLPPSPAHEIPYYWYCVAGEMSVTLHLEIMSKNYTTPLLLAMVLSGVCIHMQAQTDKPAKWRPECGAELTSEVQTNFRNEYNYVNLLRLRASLPLTRSASVELATLSASKTRDERLVDDHLVFSNIESDNIPLALAVAGASWHAAERHTLFVGVRNMNEDYFTSDVTSFFTNSSCGVFPTISCNYPIANYPVASLGMHYAYQTPRFGLQASFYNGMGYNRFGGHHSVFRFSPKQDGIFAIAQGEYHHRGTPYYLGACIHHSAVGARSTFWAYAEPRINDHISLIAGYSHALHGKKAPVPDAEPVVPYEDAPCHDFAGAGALFTLGKTELGLFSAYANLSPGYEWTTELSCKHRFNDHIYVQPTLHFIVNNHTTCSAALLRFGIEY